MSNILIGGNGCSSKHPCPLCEAKKIDKKNYDKSAELRTYGSIVKCYKLYEENKKNGVRSDDSTKSIVVLPVFDGPEDEPVIIRFVPSPLHEMLGIVNYGLDKLEEEHETVAKKFLRTANISRKSTFGRALNG